MDVTNGDLLPVEGFAQLLDATMVKFSNDIGATMWASTLIINGMDSSSAVPLWSQAIMPRGLTHFIGEDWLPYRDLSCADIEDYYAVGHDWICSDRGDWKEQYWDKTANQAYHGWYFASVTFYNGKAWANLANETHDNPAGHEPLSRDLFTPPPKNGNTSQDFALSLKMMELGYMLSLHYIDSMLDFPGQCPPSYVDLPANLKYLSPGAWIRSNLKDYSNSVGR